MTTLFFNNVKKKNFRFTLNKRLIPHNPEPVFLGIKFDEQLSFSKHVLPIKKNVMKD